MKKINLVVLLLVFLVPTSGLGAQCSSTIAQGSTESCNPIVKNGITVTFSGNVTAGQFVSGDYFVVDPGDGVSITGTSPASTTADPENGAEINPSIDPTTQGYSSRMGTGLSGFGLTYSSAKNVVLNVSGGSPRVVAAPNSIVFSITQVPPRDMLYIARQIVITVLSSQPASGSFRPPYIGTDKTINFNESDIDHSVLQNVTASSGGPSLATAAGWFAEGWFDYINSWIGRQWHPEDQMPDYGADMSAQISQATLLLHCNATNSQKRELLIKILQYGIDISAFISAGGEYDSNGGHGLGRKSLLSIAAAVLNDSTMQGQLDGDLFKFAEDRHVFVISSSDWYPAREVCGYDNGAPAPCTVAQPTFQYNSTDHPAGTAEWGRNHYSDPGQDNGLLAANYRSYYQSQLGGMLAALMAGAKQYWSREIPYDYMERVRASAHPSDCDLGFGCYYNATTWEYDMYDAYWDTYRDASPPDPTCSDSTQNGDETGVDCGGSCPACPSTATGHIKGVQAYGGGKFMVAAQ